MLEETGQELSTELFGRRDYEAGAIVCPSNEVVRRWVADHAAEWYGWTIIAILSIRQCQ